MFCSDSLGREAEHSARFIRLQATKNSREGKKSRSIVHLQHRTAKRLQALCEFHPSIFNLQKNFAFIYSSSACRAYK